LLGVTLRAGAARELRELQQRATPCALCPICRSITGAVGGVEAAAIANDLSLRRAAGAPLTILCLGAHRDDIEIGCGETILQLTSAYPTAPVSRIVFSADGAGREQEALAGAAAFLQRASEKRVVVKGFRENVFPDSPLPIKKFFGEIHADGCDRPRPMFTNADGSAGAVGKASMAARISAGSGRWRKLRATWVQRTIPSASISTDADRAMSWPSWRPPRWRRP
jgi:hypothetical protein